MAGTQIVIDISGLDQKMVNGWLFFCRSALRYAGLVMEVYNEPELGQDKLLVCVDSPLEAFTHRLSPIAQYGAAFAGAIAEITGSVLEHALCSMPMEPRSVEEGARGGTKGGPAVESNVGIENPGNIRLLSQHGPYRQETRSPPSTVSGAHHSQGCGEDRRRSRYVVEVDQGA